MPTTPALDDRAATLTPVDSLGGRTYKREDLHTGPAGVNGSKLRACQYLIAEAVSRGATSVISAASVNSPQSAMATICAAAYGLPTTIIIGATHDEAALKHPSIRIAAAAGARITHVPVGYNPYLQARARELADATPGAYWLRYGITPPPEAELSTIVGFHNTTANQVANLPDHTRTLIVPFGSGNTCAGILYGLWKNKPTDLREVVLIGIGPDRRRWLAERMDLLGARCPVPTAHIDLHGSGYARYGDRMHETIEGIECHPNYEGKVVRWLNANRPPFWEVRDDTTCLWIVGGPLPGAPGRRAPRRTPPPARAAGGREGAS